jgi:molybdopterin synthase sulfur carrier subunit
MRCRVLYFARLRERFDLAEESLELEDAASVADLIAHLQARGGPWAEELGTGKSFRVAVNQALVQTDAHIPDDSEVAIFPPVTGG